MRFFVAFTRNASRGRPSMESPAASDHAFAPSTTAVQPSTKSCRTGISQPRTCPSRPPISFAANCTVFGASGAITTATRPARREACPALAAKANELAAANKATARSISGRGSSSLSACGRRHSARTECRRRQSPHGESRLPPRARPQWRTRHSRRQAQGPPPPEPSGC